MRDIFLRRDLFGVELINTKLKHECYLVLHCVNAYYAKNIWSLEMVDVFGMGPFSKLSHLMVETNLFSLPLLNPNPCKPPIL